jgi:hypothetical protein
VAFVWVLEREMALVPEHEMHLTAHAQDRNQRVGLGEGWRAMPVRALGKFVGRPRCVCAARPSGRDAGAGRTRSLNHLPSAG